MTNEDLAVKIKEGKAKDYYIPVLWERIGRLANMLAKDYYYSHRLSCMAAGVEMDDLKQESYFGFLDAIRYYNPEKDVLFTSYMSYPLKNCFDSLCDRRTQRGKNAPLNNSVSLLDPIGEEDLTLLDMLEDKTAADEFKQIELLDYTVRLRSDLEECINSLNQKQQEVIRSRYFLEMSFADIAEMQKATTQICRTRETEALRKLRRGMAAARLQKYHDDIISRYSYKGSFGSWRNSGSSSVERAVLKMEEAAEMVAY